LSYKCISGTVKPPSPTAKLIAGPYFPQASLSLVLSLLTCKLKAAGGYNVLFLFQQAYLFITIKVM
jgi:hypothetical protein